ncbi:MAG: Mrp/NBP35 family ATP-binding protein [Bifidobacteriaceae bacterium]|nr:Mrp/NBP35 family ATP-binding protein [Bifidobacteriaceae bacterium]
MAQDRQVMHVHDDVMAALDRVMDPELGRTITDLGMVAGVDVIPAGGAAHVQGAPSVAEGRLDSDMDAPAWDVTVHLELTVPGCPLSDTIRRRITAALEGYPGGRLNVAIDTTTMSHDKLEALVERLKAERRANPFTRKDSKTRVFAIASGKGGVGKSSVTANLAATFAALGYDTAAIDADIYGFSLPRLFGVTDQPTNLDGMLVPPERWGVRLMSIGVFAGSDRAILWRGPRLQRSLEQFLTDVWWGEPDVLLLDLAPGTGDMTISVAQTLPNAELVIVTTPQPSASEVAVRAGLVSLQMPMQVDGVIENMSYFDHRGERLNVFGEGGGERVSAKLTRDLGYDVPLLARLPLVPELRETTEAGRPAVLNADGSLADTDVARSFVDMAHALMEHPGPSKG